MGGDLGRGGHVFVEDFSMSMSSQTSHIPSDAAWMGALAPLATVVIWSGNAVVTKAADGVIAPGSIAFYRWVLALVVLGPFLGPAVWRSRAVALKYWKQLAILGALGMVAYQTLAYFAAATTTAVNIGVILALMPLCSTLLGTLIAGERFTLTRMIAAVVSLSGLVYLISQGHPARLLSGGFHIGDGLMLAAVFANALYGILLTRWTMPIPIWHQLFWQMVFSVILLVPIWLSGPISPITSANMPLILYAAIPASLVAPLCWMMGIRKLGAARTALLINFLPLFVALLAWSVLGEELHIYHLIGSVVTLVGVSLGLREPQANPRNTRADVK